MTCLKKKSEWPRAGVEEVPSHLRDGGRPARIATHQSTTYRAPIAMRVLFLTAAAAAYHLTAPPSRAGNIAMDSSWRPKNVDPLGEAWGVPKKKERTYSLWLDLREAEVTFAQQSLVQLFYAVRRVVDEAGKALPRGAKVQGLLYDESRYDRADTIGADLPIFLDTGAGNLVNATVKGSVVPVPAALRAPLAREDLKGAQEELEALKDGSEEELTAAIALPADPMLWAEALTGLEPDQLVCLEANEGA